MTRSIVSLLLSTIFLVFLAAPTILVAVDNSIDVSIFYASSEEEEKGSEKNKDKEILFFEFDISESDFNLNETNNCLGYYFKNYPKPHLNLISPPPELGILS